MSAGELAARLGEPGLRICDVRWYLAEPERGRREYAAGHLPGAVFVDLERDLSGTGGPGRHPLPQPAAFAATLGQLGVSPGHTVVAYDAAGGSVAARLWWMLRSIGHRDARVLDGGLPACTAAGLHLSTEPAAPVPQVYPAPAGWTGVVDLEAVRTRPPGVILIDVRAAQRYRGEVEPVDPRAGHVPGAVNRPWTANLAPDGRFLRPEELRARYASAGEEPIVSCGSGVNACHAVLAMEVAGVAAPRLWEGSWSEWSRRADLPAATGPRP
jgi:thiosulfate/3-mercaptopyruvate sulfurtransferase